MRSILHRDFKTEMLLKCKHCRWMDLKDLNTLMHSIMHAVGVMPQRKVVPLMSRPLMQDCAGEIDGLTRPGCGRRGGAPVACRPPAP